MDKVVHFNIEEELLEKAEAHADYLLENHLVEPQNPVTLTNLIYDKMMADHLASQ